MSMLLTISQPATKTEFGGRTTHDFSPRISLAKSRVSPKPRIDSPVSALRVGALPTDSKMTAPPPHRGLPPPSAMTLPDPGRPPPSLSQSYGGMPPMPPRWEGNEENMRVYLSFRSEDERRKQEEERTRQESYKLEQRRIEQSILREALSGGVPPAMVPMIYGSANLPAISVEFLQHYAAQLQAAQQHIQQQSSSPELRRETRLISQAPPTYGAPPQQPQHQVVPSQPHEQPPQPAPLQTTFSAYQAGPSRGPPTSAPRSAAHSALPRLTTNEMYVHQPAQQGPGSAHPLQQSQTIQQQDQPTSSPSIYFHHWVPPSESKANQPQTPASKGEPLSAHPGSHLSESDYKDSPRKRKAQGAHQPAPPPSSGPQYTSPPFSTVSSGSGGRKGGHVRSRSNTSLGRESESRPDSRREPDPPRSSQPESGQSSDDPSRRPEAALPPPPVPEESAVRSNTEVQRDYRPERPESREER